MENIAVEQVKLLEYAAPKLLSSSREAATTYKMERKAYKLRIAKMEGAEKMPHKACVLEKVWNAIELTSGLVEEGG